MQKRFCVALQRCFHVLGCLWAISASLKASDYLAPDGALFLEGESTATEACGGLSAPPRIRCPHAWKSKRNLLESDDVGMMCKSLGNSPLSLSTQVRHASRIPARSQPSETVR